jgi:hypothetical protein
MEIDARYCDVVVERWQQFTKKAAALADGGRSFEQLRKERAAAAA